MITRSGSRWILENSCLRREIELGDFGIRTVSFVNRRTGGEYLHQPCREFAFTLDREYVNSIREVRYQAVDGTLLKAGRGLEFLGSSQPGCRRTVPYLPDLRSGSLRALPDL